MVSILFFFEYCLSFTTWGRLLFYHLMHTMKIIECATRAFELNSLFTKYVYTVFFLEISFYRSAKFKANALK